MISLTTSTTSIKTIYFAFKIAYWNINTFLKSCFTLRRQCNSGPRLLIANAHFTNLIFRKSLRCCDRFRSSVCLFARLHLSIRSNTFNDLYFYTIYVTNPMEINAIKYARISCHDCLETSQKYDMTYCPASQKWQWRIVLITMVK